MTPMIFWGATGQAKVLLDALAVADVELVALFDNREIPSPFEDVPIFHGESGFAKWEQNYGRVREVQAYAAIGGTRGHERLQRIRWFSERGYSIPSAIHPRAFVADTARIGSGCQILAMSAVCAGVVLGDAVIINTSASVDHDCVIGAGVHVAPGSTLAGEITVDEFAFIGTGATILPRIHIGKWSIIGAGAVVTRDVPDYSVVVGNPAEIIRRNEISHADGKMSS